MKRLTETTATFLVFTALKDANDFLTVPQLRERTGQSVNRVSAALHMLRTYKAVECLHSDGYLWWYATPENDTRTKTVDERAPELKPRKARKPRVKKVFT